MNPARFSSFRRAGFFAEERPGTEAGPGKGENGMQAARREDRTMKVPAMLHLARLGYACLSREELRRRDRGTNLLPEELRAALQRIRGEEMPEVDFARLTAEIRDRLNAEDLGREFYRMLRDGWNGWRLIDFERPERNRFRMAAEVSCGEGENWFRPDITVFVNGLPLGMIEVKTGERPHGIRAEYDRMRERFRTGSFRRFLQCAQVWMFSDDRDNDPEALLPTEGAFYATGAREDFPIHAFRETHPGICRRIGPRNREEEKRILAELGMAGLPADPEFRRSLSPRKPTHRMLTSLFLPERFLLLLRYGVHYLPARDGAVTKRLLTSGQLLALEELRGKAARGYRNWTVPYGGAAGEPALAAAVLLFLRDRFPGAEIRWLLPDPAVRRRTAGQLREDAGALRDVREESDSLLLKSAGEGGEYAGPSRVILLSERERAYGARAGETRRLRREPPDAVRVTLRTPVTPEGGNYAYLLECADGTLYCGWTNDLANRLRTHNEGRGAKYTRSRRPVRLVYYEEFGTREEAMSREWHLKRLTRAQKEQLIRRSGAFPEPETPEKTGKERKKNRTEGTK